MLVPKAPQIAIPNSTVFPESMATAIEPIPTPKAAANKIYPVYTSVILRDCSP